MNLICRKYLSRLEKFSRKKILFAENELEIGYVSKNILEELFGAKEKDDDEDGKNKQIRTPSFTRAS